MSTTPFKKTFLDEQGQALRARKKELEEELGARGKRKAPGVDDYKTTYQEYGDDDESNAAEYAQTETNLGIVENLEKELVAVDAALARIKDGTYGMDAKTGKPIRLERLKANPAASVDIVSS